jgi:hypothetical protein
MSTKELSYTVIETNEIDTDKILFGKIKKNRNVVQVYFNKKTFLLKLDKNKLAFNASDYENNRDFKFQVKLSEKDINNLQKLDTWLATYMQENSEDYFDTKLSLEETTYNSSGSYNRKYNTINIKFPKDISSVNIFSSKKDEHGDNIRIDVDNEDYLVSLLTKDTEVNVLVECNYLWFNRDKQSYGLTWTLRQLKIYPKETVKKNKINDYLFCDSSSDEEEC